MPDSGRRLASIISDWAKRSSDLGITIGASLRKMAAPSRICTGVARFFVLVIARCAKRAVAIQLDCFVAALLAMTRFGYRIF